MPAAVAAWAAVVLVVEVAGLRGRRERTRERRCREGSRRRFARCVFVVHSGSGGKRGEG